MWDVDAKFAKGVSLNPRKGKMQMQLYMTGRLKSICKFEEKQVADTTAAKRASIQSLISFIAASAYASIMIGRIIGLLLVRFHT